MSHFRISAGHYRLSERRGAWPTPARIEDDNGRFMFEIGGQMYGPLTEGEIEEALADWVTGLDATPVLRLLLYGEAIDEASYRQMVALREWARDYAPAHPCLSSEREIDLLALPDGVSF